MRLREPGLSSNVNDQRAALTTNLQSGKMVEGEHGELQAPGGPGGPGRSQVRDESPYLNRRSEEFFTNLIEFPEESVQSPNHSLLPSSPDDIGSPESFIGIALGDPEVDPQIINDPEARKGYISKAASSLGSSATLHSGLTADEYRAGTATPKEGKWASFTGRFGIKNTATTPPSLYQVRQKSPASPRPLHSNWQEVSGSGRQHTPPGIFYHHHHLQDSTTPALYPRPMEQQQRMEQPKRPSLIMRKMSWRRNPWRKSQAHIESNRGSENSHSWPLSSPTPHIEKPDTRNSTMKRSFSYPNQAEVSLLHVEIPHIEMERYSVMFSNLLQAAEQPSLLTRRQGPLARIRLATKTRTQVDSLTQ